MDKKERFITVSRAQIGEYTAFCNYLNTLLEVAERFDGKVLNVRFKKAIDEACEKVELQVNQSSFKVAEANKKLALAEKSTEQADENLRCANLGFKEGVMDVTDVMAAQTAWLQARSQKIDADIDVRLTMTNLRKVLGETIY